MQPTFLTNQNQVTEERKLHRVIGILSGKGGVGKTSLVANLGAALTDEFDKNIIILDTNLNTSHLGLHLGMYEDLPITLREIVNRNMPVSYGIYVHPNTGIRILPAALSGDGVELTSQKLRGIVEKLRETYETVILDCPPGLGRETVTSVSAIDAALIVTTPDFPAVADALKTVNLLQRMSKPILGIVVNKRRGEKYELTIKEVESTCGVRVVAVIPEDRRVPEAISEGIPVVLFSPYSPAAVAFKQLSARLVGEQYKGGGFFDRLKSAFSGPRREPKVEKGKQVTKPQNVMQPQPVAQPQPAVQPIPREEPELSPATQLENYIAQTTGPQTGEQDQNYFNSQKFEPQYFNQEQQRDPGEPRQMTDDQRTEIRQELKSEIIKKLRERMVESDA